MSFKQYIIIALETSGLDAKNDKIIEISALKVKRGLIIDEFTTLINPERSLPKDLINFTSINEEDLAKAPLMKDIAQRLEDFIGDDWLLAYNSDFAQSFLKDYLPHNPPYLDIMALAMIVFPVFDSYSLENICQHLQLINNSPGRAAGDGEAVYHIFQSIRQKLQGLPRLVGSSLWQLANKKADATDLDQWIAMECEKYYQEGDRSYYLPAYLPDPIVERDIDEEYQLPLSQIDDFFAAQAALTEKMANFEERPQQLVFSKAVAQAFNQKYFLLAEAGTGTGKSLSYLLPSVLFALGSGRQIAISTHTINLQEQLINKDIPLLEKLLDRKFNSVILKGRGNYLCLSLLSSYLKQGDAKLRPFLYRILVWLAETEDGDSSQLYLTGYHRWQWRLLSAAKDNCLAPFCTYCKSQCFVQRSRRKVLSGDIFILNHSLL
ncbi:MAG: exonuclease domain-containing protein, partial [Clostridiales bacterium]